MGKQIIFSELKAKDIFYNKSTNQAFEIVRRHEPFFSNKQRVVVKNIGGDNALDITFPEFIENFIPESEYLAENKQILTQDESKMPVVINETEKVVEDESDHQPPVDEVLNNDEKLRKNSDLQLAATLHTNDAENSAAGEIEPSSLPVVIEQPQEITPTNITSFGRYFFVSFAHAHGFDSVVFATNGRFINKNVILRTLIQVEKYENPVIINLIEMKQEDAIAYLADE